MVSLIVVVLAFVVVIATSFSTIFICSIWSGIFFLPLFESWSIMDAYSCRCRLWTMIDRILWLWWLKMSPIWYCHWYLVKSSFAIRVNERSNAFFTLQRRRGHGSSGLASLFIGTIDNVLDSKVIDIRFCTLYNPYYP